MNTGLLATFNCWNPSSNASKLISPSSQLADADAPKAEDDTYQRDREELLDVRVSLEEFIASIFSNDHKDPELSDKLDNSG